MKVIHSVFANLGCLALAWLIPWAAIRLGVHGWLTLSILQVVSAVIGSCAAYYNRALVALIVLTISGGAIAVETIVHALYGIDKVQGFPSHLAVIAATIIGLVLGRTVFSSRPAPAN